MMPVAPTPSSEALLEARPAVLADREQLANLIFTESQVHKHLDWKAPLDWLGSSPFIVLQEGQRLVAALACPPDPPSIAWVRLFVFASHLNGSAAWRILWSAARQELRVQGGAVAAAIATARWLDPILQEHGFGLVNHIVLLELNLGAARLPQVPSNHAIRPMVPDDLPRVVEVDGAAFEPLWRNSLEALTSAFHQSSYASVSEEGSQLTGYQLSTGSAFGTHLARLAVSPAVQRRGLGAALVRDLIAHIPEGSEPRVTVNTQSNNAASHALYARLGFRRTGERLPVLVSEVRSTDPDGKSSGGLN